MDDVFKDKKLKTEIENQLRDVFTDGLKQGTKAICGIVLEEISTKDKSAEDKVETLRLFCEKSLGLKGGTPKRGLRGKAAIIDEI